MACIYIDIAIDRLKRSNQIKLRYMPKNNIIFTVWSN
jgi:hypothetical protein